ncbi:MAG: SDR family oxidoreductase [Candidatus Caenarcaniphilales bacterium]|nr:SDR family oxidoreductase [Candidatus Caenarcaniphilales bacterium]
MDKTKPIWVSGGTGYVGARLIPRLLEAGYKVRAISRTVDKLTSRPWANNPNLEIYPADVLDLESLTQTMRGCSVVYYMVHSMNAHPKKYREMDKKAAQNVAKVAAQVGIERIIYLGGLGSKNSSDLSKHLQSRHEVADILCNGKVPVTVLRAAMIIGSGSASFEILRYLVDRLPIMITPKWVSTPCQPIAIRNVLTYLIGCLDSPGTIGKTLDIGGKEVVTYRDLMEMYAEEAGLPKRAVIPVPFFTPRLSSYWIHLVTPMPASIARPLAEGLKNPVTCLNNDILELVPQELLSCREAVKFALEKMEMQQIESHWTDAGYSFSPEWVYSGDPQWAGGTIYEDKRKITLKAKPEEIWQPICRIGGETGWYYGDWLWQLRGVIDRMVGGVGLRRGRRHPTELRPGDALDFWRVADLQENKRLMLIAEMKLPGQAILDFKINKLDEETLELYQTARFLPKGLFGILYWWLVTPLHFFVFNGMLLGMVKASGANILEGPELIK